MKRVFFVVGVLLMSRTAMPADGAKAAAGKTVRWIAFPDPRFEVRGLPWFAENAPDLWRLPKRAIAKGLPKVVRDLGRSPSGGRIRFASTTSQLRIRARSVGAKERWNMSAFGGSGLDVYVNGVYWKSGVFPESDLDKTFFEGADRSRKEIVIYLPTYQEVRVLAIGVDADAEIAAARPFALDKPVVFYGSSVCQGSGVCRPAMTYEAIVCRRLNLDFVNLGFGGAGKAEPEVVALVNEIEAACFVLDLGKSYGRQPDAVYGEMLDTIRQKHPSAPIVCVTPIFSTREFYEADYRDLSTHVRDAMRRAARERRDKGDARLQLIEGLELLGAGDADMFHEGVLPTDLGYERMATRLEPALRKALGLE
jgi:hypothetical protein